RHIHKDRSLAGLDLAGLIAVAIPRRRRLFPAFIGLAAQGIGHLAFQKFLDHHLPGLPEQPFQRSSVLPLREERRLELLKLLGQWYILHRSGLLYVHRTSSIRERNARPLLFTDSLGRYPPCQCALPVPTKDYDGRIVVFQS